MTQEKLIVTSESVQRDGQTILECSDPANPAYLSESHHLFEAEPVYSA